MRKEEFFEKLEYLLQDIPDQDREDALDYYRARGITWLRPEAAMRKRPLRILGARNGWQPLSGPIWQAI